MGLGNKNHPLRSRRFQSILFQIERIVIGLFVVLVLGVIVVSIKVYLFPFTSHDSDGCDALFEQPVRVHNPLLSPILVEIKRSEMGGALLFVIAPEYTAQEVYAFCRTDPEDTLYRVNGYEFDSNSTVLFPFTHRSLGFEEPLEIESFGCVGKPLFATKVTKIDLASMDFLITVTESANAAQLPQWTASSRCPAP